MKNFSIAIATAAAIFTAGLAHAAKVEVNQEIQGASLHEDGVDMVVYYTHAAENAFEVVATYVEDGDATKPYRMRMALKDGDRVTFALPGRMTISYTFARNGKTVSMETKPVVGKVDLAQASE